ncbi:YdcF family protein [Bradyrhizobium sp. U87765 SZCCT0131]|nr:YdcF family protein [Bradyrhizobium sp. U87765 SZCCT0131]MBR1259993.1 YdcF family protein [Bradyrhizobium sp. U87765 SZCCT0134]MBR1307758.1 YdcF family protein [Bradyrhizobium sp. U87765 SZCCT0110]MBR1321712.1 YdcF family protein [Bradyrhizobium sp. U87765 SZCCT0109]MBR1350024.1 YdcF family protein [Bradyrhizobium sp. U87765 SZCCT0048]
MASRHDRPMIPSDDRPSDAEIATINARHLAVTPLKPADLLFVFGSREGVALRVASAARLWRAGFFRRAIVSGGVTAGGALSECAVIKAAMVDAGVPGKLILEEHAATNTGENVILSLPVLDAGVGLDRIHSVICLGNAWTARRYPMTLHRHWPAVEKMLLTVNSFGVPMASWPDHSVLRALVLAEWAKIEPYKRSGFIADWPPAGV